MEKPLDPMPELKIRIGKFMEASAVGRFSIAALLISVSTLAIVWIIAK